MWKLFSRHVPLKEHVDALTAKNPRQGGRVINLYIGVPNRIRALAEVDKINLTSKKLKSLVFDCSTNKKGFTLFETHETRDDTFATVLHLQKQLFRRKLNIIFNWKTN